MYMEYVCMGFTTPVIHVIHRSSAVLGVVEPNMGHWELLLLR